LQDYYTSCIISKRERDSRKENPKQGAIGMIELYIYLGLYMLAVIACIAVLPLLYLAIYQNFAWALLYVSGLILLCTYLIFNASGLTTLSGIKMALGMKTLKRTN
jgi:hypothetical protein